MYDVYLNYGYPFVYAAMIGDKVDEAYDRLDIEYNFGAYPTTFFDGGYSLYVGGSTSRAAYAGRIAASLLREVPPLDLSIQTEWLGNAQVQVTVRIGNGVLVNEVPPTPLAPTGDELVSKTFDGIYKFVGNDPEDDSLYYQVQWGNGDTTAWIGPREAGDTLQMTYSWDTAAFYDVQVRVKDVFEGIGGWSDPLPVEVSCCVGYTGNTDNDEGDRIDIGDLTKLIDYLFITYEPPVCMSEGNTDGVGSVDIGDLTALISYLFITYQPPAYCN